MLHILQRSSRKAVTAKLPLWIFSLLVPLAVFAQTEKLVVTAEEADIHAEPYGDSYLIETVKQGTVLSLFQKTKVNRNWYYVRFQSRRYGGPAMGFIRDSLVAPFTGEKPLPKEKPGVQIPPLPEPEKAAPPQVKAPPPKKEAAPVKKKEPEPPEKKEPLVTIEESDIPTSQPSGRGFTDLRPAPSFPETLWLLTQRIPGSTILLSARYLQLPPSLAELTTRVWPLPQPSPPRPQVSPEKVSPPPKEKPKPIPKPEGKKAAERELSPQLFLTRGKDFFEFQLRMGAYTSYNSFEMANPNRIVFDFVEVEQHAGFDRREVNDLGIETIRVGMFKEDTARVVFDFSGQIPAYQIEQTQDGLKILFWPEGPMAAPETEAPAKKEFTPPKSKSAPPKPEPAAEKPVIEEIPLSTAIPIQQRFSQAEPLSSPRERLFLLVEREGTETFLPGPTLDTMLPAAPLPREEYWQVTRVQPLQDTFRPEPEPMVIPPPKGIPEPRTEAKETKATSAKTKPKPKKSEKKPEEKDQVIIPPQKIKPPGKPTLPPSAPSGPPRLLLGLGYGASKGGLGGSLQYNLSETLALHGGIGYFPTTLIYSETDWVENSLLFSAGIKVYGPDLTDSIRSYLNFQYGGFTVEAVQIIEGIWNYQFIFRNEQRALFGPQALVGGELSWGKIGLNAAAGAAYALTDWEWLPQKFYFTFDIGLFYRLK